MTHHHRINWDGLIFYAVIIASGLIMVLAVMGAIDLLGKLL